MTLKVCLQPISISTCVYNSECIWYCFSVWKKMSISFSVQEEKVIEFEKGTKQ